MLSLSCDWHKVSAVFIVTCGIFSCGIWDLFPWPGIKHGPLYWELTVLATEPPGKTHEKQFDSINQRSYNCTWFLTPRFCFNKYIFLEMYSKKIITNMSKEDLQTYFHSSIICNFKKTSELKCSAVKNQLIKYSTPNDAILWRH